MNSELRNREIIEYIDKLVSGLTQKYPNMSFSNVRNNAVAAFTKMDGDFETIKVQIDASFSSAIQNMNLGEAQERREQPVDESFEMTPEEQTLYQQLKQENLEKRKAMSLGNAKKLVLQKTNEFNNNGYVNFLIIMGIVLIVLVVLIVVVCNVLL